MRARSLVEIKIANSDTLVSLTFLSLHEQDGMISSLPIAREDEVTDCTRRRGDWCPCAIIRRHVPLSFACLMQCNNLLALSLVEIYIVRFVVFLVR